MRAAADHQLLSPLDPRRTTVTCACSHLIILQERLMTESHQSGFNAIDSGPIEVDIRWVALCFLPIGLPRMSCLALACLPLCLLVCLRRSLRQSEGKRTLTRQKSSERERRVTGRRTSAKKITSPSPPSLLLSISLSKKGLWRSNEAHGKLALCIHPAYR